MVRFFCDSQSEHYYIVSVNSKPKHPLGQIFNISLGNFLSNVLPLDFPWTHYFNRFYISTIFKISVIKLPNECLQFRRENVYLSMKNMLKSYITEFDLSLLSVDLFRSNALCYSSPCLSLPLSHKFWSIPQGCPGAYGMVMLEID